MRILAMLASCVLVVGCGGDSDEPHLPKIIDVGGPHMTHPQLVPIFFSDDFEAERLTSFSQWIVTSRWLDEVGAEYGVGGGAVLGIVHETVPSPDAITDTQIIDLLFQGLADGSVPPPPVADPDDALYMFYFPAHTVITSFGATSCDAFGGYHGSARRDGVEVAYAVIASCSDINALTEVEVRELVASHELIEAATDPLPSNRPGFQLRDPTISWLALGGEVADLCEGTPASVWREAGFVTQRSWSNAAAATGDPCVPIPEGSRYANVAADSGSVPRIPPGGKKDFKLTGWSTSMTSDWMLSARSAIDGDATLTFADAHMNAGKATTLTVMVPATAIKPSQLQLFVYSVFSNTDYQILPVRVIVDDPCSSFASCAECNSHSGCGFCTTSGRCETEGAAGSAESSCPASAFATWPGSCPGFCAAHSGGCNECASQPGCGWCATGGVPQCQEASHDYAHPQGATCTYADWSFTPAYCPL